MKVNELFCRECVEQIYVPDVVRVDLLSIIEEKLKKAEQKSDLDEGVLCGVGNTELPTG